MVREVETQVLLVMVITMKMFPHPFVHSPNLNQKIGAFRASSDGGKTNVKSKRDCMNGAKSIKIDLEDAVAVMLSAGKAGKDRLPQQIRLDIMKALPSDAIDWETVDWAQVWPFQTVRH